MSKYAFLVDLQRCMGCMACVEACKVENNTGQGMFWMYVFRLESGTYPNVRYEFMPRPCMHCDNPPCVKVCPVGARYKRPDGFVLTNFETCIGCRICSVSCPYSVNYFNWQPPGENRYYRWRDGEGDNVLGGGRIRDSIGNAILPYQNPDHQKLYGPEQRLTSGGGHDAGIMEKCTWCVHRVERGLLPACVANCPPRALLFGDAADPNSEVSKLLAQKKYFRLLEEAGTRPNCYYIGRPQPPLHAEDMSQSHKEGIV